MLFVVKAALCVSAVIRLRRQKSLIALHKMGILTVLTKVVTAQQRAAEVTFVHRCSLAVHVLNVGV